MTARRWITVFATALFSPEQQRRFCAGEGARTWGHGHDKGDDDDSHGHAAFSSYDREVMRGWYDERENGLPPGLTKRDQLPPGLEKQLRAFHS